MKWTLGPLVTKFVVGEFESTPFEFGIYWKCLVEVHVVVGQGDVPIAIKVRGYSTYNHLCQVR